MKQLISSIILILSWICFSQSAFALAEVKSSAHVNKSIVTLGDLLDNLEHSHDIWVTNAPAPGGKATVSTKYLASLTRQHGVYWQNSRNIRHIMVTRDGKSVKHKDFEPLVNQELKKRNRSAKNTGVSFDNGNASIYLPEDASIEEIILRDFSFNEKTKKFTANLSVPLGDGNFTAKVIRGRIHAISYVPTLNNIIAPGKEITEQDIAWVPLATLRIGRNIIQSKSQLIGMTPRRRLPASTPLKLSDLERPTIITRGKMVSILFKSGKISLTAIGKAIEKGGRGDMIRVINSKSHKTIEAVVTGPQQVQVIAGQNGLAQLTALQN